MTPQNKKYIEKYAYKYMKAAGQELIPAAVHHIFRFFHIIIFWFLVEKGLQIATPFCF